MYLHKVFVESKIRHVASGGPPLFDRSVNPISTKGGTLSPPSTMCPPEFSDLATALKTIHVSKFLKKERFLTCLVSYGREIQWVSVSSESKIQ
jgi:hypothetical protein